MRVDIATALRHPRQVVQLNGCDCREQVHGCYGCSRRLQLPGCYCGVQLKGCYNRLQVHGCYGCSRRLQLTGCYRRVQLKGCSRREQLNTISIRGSCKLFLLYDSTTNLSNGLTLAALMRRASAKFLLYDSTTLFYDCSQQNRCVNLIHICLHFKMKGELQYGSSRMTVLSCMHA